jgi:hypothetical protein
LHSETHVTRKLEMGVCGETTTAVAAHNTTYQASMYGLCFAESFLLTLYCMSSES